VGSELIYFVKVSTKNIGASSNVELDLTRPTGYSVTRTYADRGSGCKGTAPKLVCDVAWVAPGTNTNVTIWGTVGQAGQLVATASVKSLSEVELAANLSDNTATLTLSPPLTNPGGGTGGDKPAAGGGGAIAAVVHAAAVSGVPATGHVLRAVAVRWSKKPSRVTYRWQSCLSAIAGGAKCSAIKGATKASLAVTKTLRGRAVRVVVTATVAGKKLTSVSKPVVIRRR
jgi:hypothetical protein